MNDEIVNDKNTNVGKNILIAILIFILIGFIGSMFTHIMTKYIGDNVQVKITSIDTYDDYDLGRKHIIYGEIISKGDYQGEKVRFSVPLETHYKIGDIINGKYYKKYFILSKDK